MTAPYRDVHLPQIVPSERVDHYDCRGGAWAHLEILCQQAVESDPRVKIRADGHPDGDRFIALVEGWVDICNRRGLLRHDHEPLDLVARWAASCGRAVALGHRMPDGSLVSLETWWASTHPKGPYL